MQQVVGYRLQEQRQWNMEQLPSNSVLRKSYPGSPSLHYEFSFKKEKLPAISLPVAGSYPLPSRAVPKPAAVSTSPLFQSHPSQPHFRYHEWLRQALLKDQRRPGYKNLPVVSPKSKERDRL